MQPIVSLSLGCTAVLLVGGLSRNEPPTPLLVRHGDAVVFTGGNLGMQSCNMVVGVRVSHLVPFGAQTVSVVHLLELCCKDYPKCDMICMLLCRASANVLPWRATSA